MYFFSEPCAFSINIVDKLTEDACTMLDQQENRSECIREIFLDFLQVNGIINDYDGIPTRDRLKKYFGCETYSGKAAAALQPDNKKVARCHYQFRIPFHNRREKLARDACAMLSIHANRACFIRELILDFVRVNGIVLNYVAIEEKERLERFFGYAAKSEEQPGRIEGIPKGKDPETQSAHHETGNTDSSVLTHTMPGGIVIRISIEQQPQ